MGIPRSTPKFGFFLYRPFVVKRFPAVVAGQEKAPDTRTHKAVFFYARTVGVTLARHFDLPCPNPARIQRGTRGGQVRPYGTGIVPPVRLGKDAYFSARLGAFRVRVLHPITDE